MTDALGAAAPGPITAATRPSTPPSASVVAGESESRSLAAEALSVPAGVVTSSASRLAATAPTVTPRALSAALTLAMAVVLAPNRRANCATVR